MIKLAHKIDLLNIHIGRTVAWLTLGMVVLMCGTVVLRYVFNTSAVWQQELVRYLHAIIFMSAAGYTLLRDGHVRVDVFYQRFSERGKAWVNLIGTLVLLFPVCVAIMYYSYGMIVDSWAIYEPSPEPLGLPGVFIIKSFIWVFCITLILQGVSTICKSLEALKQ